MPSAAHSLFPRIALGFLLLFAAALPHSIAAAEAAATLALLFWLVALATRKCRFNRSLLDLPIGLFLLVSILAAVTSLEPAVSIPKLAGAALILIVLVVAGTLRSPREALLLIAVLLVSAAASTAPVVWDKMVGRGVDVVSVAPGSPFAKTGLLPHDVLLACDAEEIRSPAHFQELLARHNRSQPLVCEALRGGAIPGRVMLAPDELPAPGSPAGWGLEVKTGRSIRARGTYSHFVTYAEVMLQLAALSLGLWLAYPRKRSARGAALAGLVLLLVAALAATFTRASWAALALAALAMLWLRASRRWRVVLLVAAPLALLGLNAALVQWRGVGFYNPADLSMQYRRMMWADGLRVIGEHPLLGIGQDTVLVRWQELGVRAYAQFGLHSHFHSTPIQLAVERGLLGLAAWLLLMALYVRLLWRLVAKTKGAEEWWRHGLALGIFGATSGFLASGLVHYNFGDSEVVMLFWLLMGVTVVLERLVRQPAASG